MPERAAALSKRGLVLATIAVLVPSWMGMIDGTVVNVGLGTVAGSLSATVDEAAWISSIYALSAIFAMPFTGWFSTNYGRPRAFAGAIVVFTVGSLLCALSGTLTELVLARFVQGLGGGLIIPLAMAAIIDAYPPENVATAFKVYGSAIMIGPAIGPALGGWMLANFHWSMIFLINIPLGVLSIYMVLTYLPAPRARSERSRFDWFSFGLMAVGVVAFQYFIQEGPRRDWFADFAVTLAAVAAVGAGVAFVRRQWLAKVPFVDLRPLTIPSFAVGLSLALVTGIGFTGTALIVPLYMQEVLRYGPDIAGLIMVPSAIGIALGTEVSGRLNGKVPSMYVAAFALLLCSASTYWFAVLGDRVAFEQSVPPRLLQGIGTGLLYVPLNMLMMSKVPARLVDASSGLGSLIRQVGIGLGLAILSSVLVRQKMASLLEAGGRARSSPLAVDAGLSAANRWFLAHGFSPGYSEAASMSVLQEIVTRAAVSAAYSRVFLLAAFLFLVAVPFVALFKMGSKEQTQAT